jgi:sugar transferase EpsL
VGTSVYRRCGKRLFDVCGSLTALVVAAPLLITVGIAVRIVLGSPVLFQQRRPGKNGQPFRLLKFRSMTETRDITGRLLSDADRLTKFGRWLRSTSLDELPELLNVLQGHMSLVGPRPLLPQYLERYNRRQARRHEVKPGLTGLAQVNGRNNISWHDKLELDVRYVETYSFMRDLRIIGKTFLCIAKREGISQLGEATAKEFTGEEQ